MKAPRHAFNLMKMPPKMTRTRDTLALFAIATLAILVTLYADADLGQIFDFILARW